MKLLKFAVPFAAVALAVPAWAQEADEAASQECGSNPVNAVVKLEVETAKAVISRPWLSVTDGGHGSGVVIENGRILTCAHCVADASYIRVRKHNEDALYHGVVLFVDHGADLALLGVEDPAFMADITPLEIGNTPHMQDEVLAVGYPIGGDDISYTRGIVSRIEDIAYSHSYGMTTLLGIQVDAAINRGNSGGPVLDMKSGKIAGIAFQGEKKGEALGYIIPPDIIRHFLEDIKDGKVDGFCHFLFEADAMESPTKRSYYRMNPSQTGVVIDHVDSALGSDSVQTGDILLEIGGYRVSNNGKIRLKGGEPRSLWYPLYLRQIGEKVSVKVLRGGAVTEISIPVVRKSFRAKDWMYDTRPDYFVYGGFVFTTLSLDYVAESETNFREDLMKDREFSDDEAVVISYTFSDAGIVGYFGASGSIVRNVNGVKVRNLRHLVEIIDGCSDGYVCLALNNGEEWNWKVIVDAQAMRETTRRVMRRNQIPSDRSEDLRKRAAQE